MTGENKGSRGTITRGVAQKSLGQEERGGISEVSWKYGFIFIIPYYSIQPSINVLVNYFTLILDL